jgi:predicted DNA-binding transcriptional regulator AlpA
MSTETSNSRKSRTRAIKQPVLFITKPQLAHALGVDAKTIDDWVAAGTFPPPHSMPGERTVLWRRDYFEHYVEKREWPRAAFYEKDGDE